ncbi:hypothetical protein BSKO_02283 [Bryopsis sp. KO-2023]|nr:hypothetical protein BSKO_02283 [Bryopsis sp. KO-2023]
MRRVGFSNRTQFGLEYSTLVTLQPKENVDSLLFDIELDEKKKAQAAPIPLRIGQRVRSALNELSRASDPVGVKLMEDIERAKLASANVRSPVEFFSRREDALASALRELGYDVDVLSYSILSKPGNDSGLVGGRGFPSDHKYLSIVPKITGDFETEEFIVELNFREQFVIQNPPVRYEEVLELVPEEFVGTVDNLNHLIPLLCDEMARAFTARRQFLPPWRSCEVLRARWAGSGREPGAASCLDFKVGGNQHEEGRGRWKPKGKVSLLSIKLAEMKGGPKSHTRKMVKTMDMQKKVLSEVANLRLAAKIGKCGVQVDKDEMRKVWANALLTQIHRGWFGHS